MSIYDLNQAAETLDCFTSIVASMIERQRIINLDLSKIQTLKDCNLWNADASEDQKNWLNDIETRVNAFLNDFPPFPQPPQA